MLRPPKVLVESEVDDLPEKEEKEIEVSPEILDNLDTDTSTLFPDLPL